jgi:transcriptional regulator GlxA family with amidase domain
LSFLPLAIRGAGLDHVRMTTDIAVLVFDKLATQDAVGPYEVMRNVPDWEVRFVAKQKGLVRSEGGLALHADYALEEVERADIVVIPGGIGSRPLLEDDEVLSWLRAIDATTRWTTSVCTGSLILGAAGLLKGKRATSNWVELESLRQYGADPVGGRWVEDGKVITAAGVTAGLDMALHLVDVELGPVVAQAVQLGIEYDPDPPYDSGSPEKAPAEIVELVRSVSEANAATPG